MDKYRNFAELSNAEGADAFLVTAHSRHTAACIIAPHGGSIEPGTSELALALAGDKISLYLFEGRKPTNNRDLHITSTNFDEPAGVQIVTSSQYCVAFHGCAGDDEVVYLGGRDADLKAILEKHLKELGFVVARHENPELQGESSRNICNRGLVKKGVQFEISRGLRDRLTDTSGRLEAPSLQDFVNATRRSLAEHEEQVSQ
ncbi:MULTISPECIES: poly-gamma-glutamate hydrolase family protein [unclassified Rhizobium]|uniref:poly-gamma-glutamate hydrolase family protein n=1 Tax=unclassified Rhizobium TaxID=2613769 RepID=UPI001AE10CD2|nr:MULTISPECIES: poly-gamma-glutamate hydrolase family protein [unclassified Rhizobium]MBP2463940.1 phage replication-related protein YjqB (UPF0714/DUF867 family) [Rhizobium sp. PvP014]MBP2532306.1 phage replication-related protein YjqB (UPF0714/DUF867 family) [Rhizobium sp. PvP099]